jgi:hypothetical protein
MTVRSYRRSRVVVKAATCLAFLAPLLGFGQGFNRVSVRVPVEIDGRPVRCQLYLKLEMESYNVPFDVFAAKPGDKAEAMFATGVQAIRKEDVTKFASVWTSPDQMKVHSDLMVKMSDESPAAWLKLARSNFDFEHLTVVAEVLVGMDSMFIFDSATKAGIQRYALYVGPDQKDQPRLSAVSSASPVETMVLDSFVSARSAPDDYKPLPNVNLRYQYPIPLAKLASGAHPVFLEFDGQPVDFPTTDEKVKPPTDVLAFFREANLAYKGGKNDVYSSDFTPKSQEKVKQWLANIELRKQERLKQEQEKKPAPEKPKPEQTSAPKAAAASASKPKVAAPTEAPISYVKFVLNADPIFLVFQTRGMGSDWTPANLSYSYILRQGSDYKITNFGYSNTLDDLLQDPSLFDKNVLKPRPKPGTPSAKGVPAPAKPAIVDKK